MRKRSAGIRPDMADIIIDAAASKEGFYAILEAGAVLPGRYYGKLQETFLILILPRFASRMSLIAHMMYSGDFQVRSFFVPKEELTENLSQSATRFSSSIA